MKILVMEAGPKGHYPSEEEEKRQKRIRSYVSPGTEVVFGHQEEVDFWRSQPTDEATRRRNEALFRSSLIKTAIKAERDGFDAVVAVWGLRRGLGIEEARHYVRIPIIDFGKIALLLSHLVGNNLGNIYYTDEMVERHKREGEVRGIEGFKIISIGSPNISPSEMHTRPAELREKFVKAARKCVEEGAELILAGHSIIPGTLDADEMTREVGVPVLNAIKLGMRMAEFIVQNGLTHSERAYPRKVYAGEGD
ncbi:MAG: hypothetical protein HY673_18750 [Chloroflexi bacterium]|nr:hypothetical protein [Chloroflexota bacterium]